MTDPAELKEGMKKDIRALLISSPAPLTVKELQNDYYNFLGKPMQYREIGYTTIEDFLRDIEDAVTIQFKNGMMTLKAKADETTIHIERLVSKQKVTNKKKYAVYRNRGGGPPRFYQGRNQPPRRSAAPKPVVPAYVKKQMKELFHSFPDGIPVTHLESAFSRIYGTGLIYGNYGFQNQYDFLQSLTDVVKIEEISQGEWRVLPLHFTVKVAAPAKPTVRTKQDNEEKERTPTEPQPSSHSRGHAADSRRHRRPSKGRGRRRENSGGSDGVVGHDSGSVGSAHSRDDEDLEREIREVLEKKPNGVWASRFLFEFTEVHGKAVNYREHGYTSVIDFLSAMPDVVRAVRPNPQGDWMLYDARLPDPAEQETGQSRVRQCSGKGIEAETKEAIQIILNSLPAGVSVKDFPLVFKEHTGRNLPFKQLGFDSPEALFLSLADSVLQCAYNGNEMMMYSVDTEIIQTEPEANHPRLSMPTEVPRSDNYPSDAVGPGCHFVPVMLPNPEQYVELYVTNVVNPGLFWVMLRHKTNSLALEELMDRLDEVYDKNQEADTYRMPESLMVPGQICATLFPEDNNWHRGVITGINEAGFIEVYYVDYGNTNSVQKSTVRFLKNQFITLPAQAVQARLANTHPVSGVNGKWKIKSRSRLLELTCHRPLVAYICDVKSQKMSLCLTDTNQADVDVHVNDVMVNEGMAIFIPDEEVSVPVDRHLAEPDYGAVFGWNSSETPRLPKVAESHKTSRSESEGSQKETRCYVKWIQLDESCVLHLINLNRQAYLVSAEISNLFWEEDVLTSMLKKKRVEFEKRVISSDEYSELFQELVKYRVKSVRCGGEAKQQYLSLYRLESLPDILRLFEHGSETLLKAVQELIVKFDPDSPYWKSGSDTSVEDKPSESVPSESVQDEESGEQPLSTEEKQMALRALQYKRKRILQSMMNSAGSLQDDVVNQLNNCEVEIMMLKQELEEQTATASLDNSTRSVEKPLPTANAKNPDLNNYLDTLDQRSENQRVIQNIIASATKPIAAANIMTKPVTSTSTSKPVTSTSQVENQSKVNANFVPQSATGSYRGMLGMQNMAFMQQQQRMLNPIFMAQPAMGNMANPVMQGNLGLGMGFNPNFQPGLVPQLNPLLFQMPQVQNMTMPGPGLTGPNPQMAGLQNVGRGQVLNPSSVGILPGLLPLVQNLSAGRGRGSGSFNNQ